MKKIILSLAVVLCSIALFSCGNNDNTGKDKIALITDVGDITDKSFNQTTWEAVKSYATEHKYDYKYYKPTADTTDARVEKVDQAVAEGYNVIVMPGYKFGETIKEVMSEYPEVKFIAIDVSEGDLGEGVTLTDNVHCIVFQEEQAGYLAGYAAVMDGETNLGFLGGMAVPAVVRYGYGYAQGVVDAAAEKNVDVNLWYVYGGQFFGDATITAAMDAWMEGGCETIFACGGGIYSSVVEAIANNNGEGKLIGVDTDQSLIVEGCTVLTSATKGLGAATIAALDKYFDGKWSEIGGKIATYGLKDGSSMVGIPEADGSWNFATYTKAQNQTLIDSIVAGNVEINNDITVKIADIVKDSKVTLKNANAGGSIK